MTQRYSIRDFGYPESDPLHYGVLEKEKEKEVGVEARGESGGDTQEEADQKLILLYSFIPENDNELALNENQVVIIHYQYGQGWLVAQDPQTGETGLIPEEYVELYSDAEQEEVKPFLPEFLQEDMGNESDWEDED